jgi:hypothetical protein
MFTGSTLKDCQFTSQSTYSGLYTFGTASCSYIRICKQAAKSACQFRKCLLFQHIWPISAYATGLKTERLSVLTCQSTYSGLYTFGRASCSYFRICKQAAKSACQFRKCLLFQHIWLISGGKLTLCYRSKSWGQSTTPPGCHISAQQSMLVAFDAKKKKPTIHYEILSSLTQPHGGMNMPANPLEWSNMNNNCLCTPPHYGKLMLIY